MNDRLRCSQNILELRGFQLSAYLAQRENKKRMGSCFILEAMLNAGASVGALDGYFWTFCDIYRCQLLARQIALLNIASN